MTRFGGGETVRPGILAALGGCALAFFLGWSGLPALMGAGPGVPLAAATPSQLSDATSWLPLAARVAEGNLFPSMASLDPRASGFAFYPYISLWAYGLLIKLFGAAGALLVGGAVFPALSFVFLYLLYTRMLPARWAVALAAVGVAGFAHHPFREFLSGLVTGVGWSALGAAEPPAIMDFPMPALSLLTFLALFYVATDAKRLTPARLTALTVLWALQSQVHPVNFFAGSLFWLLTFPFRLSRQNPGATKGALAARTLAQYALWLVVAAPAILAALGVFGGGVSPEELGLSAGPSGQAPGLFYHFAYFALPLGLLALTYVASRVDPYEMFLRFWPIFVLMATELALVNLPRVASFAVAPDMIFTRLGLFFLHFYYFVPALYYVLHSQSHFRSGTEALPVFSLARRGLQWTFGPASRVYIPLSLALLILFGAASMGRNLELQRVQAAPAMRLAKERLVLLTRDAGPGAVAAESGTVNLLLPVAGGRPTLWVNRFSNRVSLEECVDRLALHARLFGWTEDEFSRFMLPGRFQSQPGEPLVAETRAELVASGLGHWLALHRSSFPDEAARKTFETYVRERYRGLSLPQALARFGVTRILADGPLPADVPVGSREATPLGTLYGVKNG